MKALLVFGLLFCAVLVIALFVCPHEAMVTPYTYPTPTYTAAAPVAPFVTIVPGSEYGTYHGMSDGHHVVAVFGDGDTNAEMALSCSGKVLSMQFDQRLRVMYSEEGAVRYETAGSPYGHMEAKEYVISRIVYYDLR